MAGTALALSSDVVKRRHPPCPSNGTGGLAEPEPPGGSTGFGEDSKRGEVLSELPPGDSNSMVPAWFQKENAEKFARVLRT